MLNIEEEYHDEMAFESDDEHSDDEILAMLKGFSSQPDSEPNRNDRILGRSDGGTFLEEIDIYLELATSKKMNISKFWSLNSHKMSKLFKIVQSMLVVPATQTSSEREFSRAKLTKNYRRHNLDDSTFQKLTVLSSFCSQKTPYYKKRTIEAVENEEDSPSSVHNQPQNDSSDSEESKDSEEDLTNESLEDVAPSDTSRRSISKIVIEECQVQKNIIYAFLPNSVDIDGDFDILSYFANLHARTFF